MNLKTSSGNRISGLLALMLFLIFSVCILGVLLSTADAYQRLNEPNSRSGDRRTGMMFLSTKVRQYDRAEQVRVEDLAGAPALVLTEELDGERYKTVLYAHDGYLYELFTPEEITVKPGDGEPVLPVSAMEAQLSGSLLTISLTSPDGTVTTQNLMLCSGEVAP